MGSVTKAMIPRVSSPHQLLGLLASHPNLSQPLQSGGTRDENTPPFAAGWLYSLSYELGAIFEPAARHNGVMWKPTWPLMVSQRVDDAYIFDHARSVWWAIGEPPAPEPVANDKRFALGALTSDMEQAGYMQRVQRVLEYIRAGDVYQVNLAHRMRARFAGSHRGLFAKMMQAAQPWMGAYMEFEDGDVPCALASASPELFIDYDPATRRVTTRPMKGTRQADADATQAFAHDLRDSVKDQAELTMIVDLMRNDLGRVSELGSVRVETPRTIESHGSKSAGVLQATATVSARVMDGLTWLELLRAIFPGGSVTGAPKIRAMQIIAKTEPVQRGFYAGALGYFGYDGNLDSCIMLRTSLIKEGRIHIQSGAGVVADSVPLSEYQETISKASALFKAVAIAQRLARA